jgi:hypothetical protein
MGSREGWDSDVPDLTLLELCASASHYPEPACRRQASKGALSFIFAAASLHQPTFDFQLSTVDFPPTMLKSCLATYEHSL